MSYIIYSRINYEKYIIICSILSKYYKPATTARIFNIVQVGSSMCEMKQVSYLWWGKAVAPPPFPCAVSINNIVVPSCLRNFNRLLICQSKSIK